MEWGQGGRSGRVRKPSRPSAWDDRAASEVVGTIILVAITVVMAAGFAVLLGTFGEPVNRTRADLDVAINSGSDDVWGTGDEEIVIRHLGGEGMDPETTIIRIQIGSASQELTGSALGTVFDDRFRIGETFFFVPSDAPFSGIPVGANVDVTVIGTQGGSSIVAALTVSAGGVSVPGGFQLTYLSSIPPNPVVGTLTDGAKIMVAESPPPAEVGKYDEGTAPISTTADNAGTSATNIAGTTDHENADGLPNENLYATLATGTSIVEVMGWDTSSTATITSVTAVVESKYVETGGQGLRDDQIRLRYMDTTTPVSAATFTPSLDPAETQHSMTLTHPSGSWGTDWSKIGDIRLRAEYVQNSQGGKDNINILVDALWLKIETTDTVNALNAQMPFTGVPNGNQWTVESRYLSTDTFALQVLTGGSWAACGTLPLSGTLTNATGCSLSLAQYNGGSPTLRVVDTGSTPTTQHSISFDYVRIRTT